jgi:hypothetical protein
MLTDKQKEQLSPAMKRMMDQGGKGKGKGKGKGQGKKKDAA